MEVGDLESVSKEKEGWLSPASDVWGWRHSCGSGGGGASGSDMSTPSTPHPARARPTEWAGFALETPPRRPGIVSVRPVEKRRTPFFGRVLLARGGSGEPMAFEMRQ